MQEGHVLHRTDTPKRRGPEMARPQRSHLKTRWKTSPAKAAPHCQAGGHTPGPLKGTSRGSRRVGRRENPAKRPDPRLWTELGWAMEPVSTAWGAEARTVGAQELETHLKKKRKRHRKEREVRNKVSSW